MDILGDSWTPLVLREAFYGIRKFDEFQVELGIARNTLTERLRRLVDEGLLEKRPYDDSPRRYECLLTEKGREFLGVLLAMSRWGDRWLSGEDGPPVTLHHDTCGRDTHAEVTCAICCEPLAATNTSMRMGPGYPPGSRTVPRSPGGSAAPPEPQTKCPCSSVLSASRRDDAEMFG